MKTSSLFLMIVVFAALGTVPPAAAPVRDSGAGEDVWPLGLGTLASVPARYPPEDGSVGAARLKSLASGVGIDFDVTRWGSSQALTRQIATWIETQIIGTGDGVNAPPREVLEFFGSHEHQVNAIRALLVSAPIAWPLHVDRTTHAPLPNLRAHLAVTRLLVARALLHASWDDLHAAAALQRGLRDRPELISQLVALTSIRMIVAAARKLPAPAPTWFGDLMQFDARRATIAAIQWEAWNIEQEAENGSDESNSVRDRLQEIIMKPFDEIFAANYVAFLRSAAVELASSRQCAFDGAAFDHRLRSDLRFWNLLAGRSLGNLGAHWQRVARFTAEREGTAIVLSLKEGRTPRLSSSCSDGAWRIARDSGGSKHLRFSRRIPVRRPQIAIPLEYTTRP